MPKIRHRDVLAFVTRYARIHAWALVLVVSLSVVSTGFFLLQPFFYREAIDAIASAAQPDPAVFRFALWQFVIGVGVAMAAFGIEQVGGLLLGKVETKVMRRAHADVFAIVQRHAMGFHASQFAGSTSRKITRGTDAIEGILDKIFLNFLPTIILMIGFMVVLSLLALPIALAMFLGMIVYAAFSVGMNLSLTRMYNWVDSQDTRVTGNLVDAISSNALVKSFAAEPREDQRHGSLLQEWERRQWLAWVASTGVTLVQYILLLLIELVVFVLAVWLWYRGEFTPGGFIILIFYMGQLWGRLWDFGRNVREYIRSVSRGEEMVEVALKPLGVRDAPHARPLVVRTGAVRFENVLFQYEQASQPVFEQFSVAIRPGERIALVGHSGGGKSTFVKLLMRLYDVQEGRILIDDQHITDVTQESLRNAVALVPQDPVLFHRSIAENIAYGSPGASREQIERAARLAHAHEFISVLPKGYETLVGERGVKLSGGERQRVAIARALLADKPILVLDEATSSLDSLSEQYIQEALARLMKGRTSIVIAHRLSTIKQADRILVIDRGQILEEGTHAALLAKEGGIYRHLFELQAGGFI
ncbi:MAG: ABC transporter ATP-binding protein [Candidatus Peribacteraceae bacterium]|jgi:ATP-binding cassette subfamily B protein|nr:ABC transporter ATP-binding protein [Candidatus Peribacteraceae bacterium]